MLITATLEPQSRKAWRDWLERHHDTAKEIWLVFSKRTAGAAAFGYREALLEALCFGWIDGVRQRLDDAKYAQRFSPRTRRSRWSSVNLSLARELQAEGRMAPSGLAALDQAVHPPEASTGPLPPEGFMAALRADPVALMAFERLPASHQRRYVGWVSAAKRDATRQGRIAEAIALLRQNKRLGLGPGEVRK